MKTHAKSVLLFVTVLAVALVAAVAFSRFIEQRKGDAARPSASDSSLLVLTWGPSFCTLNPSNRGCRSGHMNKLGHSFVLHGLWPQPSTEQYCDVPKRMPDRKRAPVQLPADVQAGLPEIMSDPDELTTHEWYAHGTCSGIAAPQYFATATALTKQALPVLNPLFSKSVGHHISVRAVRDAVEAAFGAGAGQRVALACRPVGDGPGDRAEYVYEVRLSLPAVAGLRDGDNVLPLGTALGQGPQIPAGCGKALVA